MRNRSSWLLALTAFACVVIIGGIVVPGALAKPKGKPGVTPPGVPPGQPFQALQRQIDTLNGQVTDLDVRVDDLEAAVETLQSLSGMMWLNTLDFRAGTSILGLDPTAPGLLVTGVVVAADVVRVGLQVPLGFAIAGVRVCYVSGGAGSFVSNIALLQYAAIPATPPATVLTENPLSPGASTLSCVNTISAISIDPSAGGAVYLSLGIAFNAAEAIALRAIGLELEPVGP